MIESVEPVVESGESTAAGGAGRGAAADGVELMTLGVVEVESEGMRRIVDVGVDGGRLLGLDGGGAEGRGMRLKAHRKLLVAGGRGASGAAE